MPDAPRTWCAGAPRAYDRAMTSPSASPAAVAANCTSIDDVIAAMKSIQATLPPEDGVASFNRLYLAVTEAVGDEVKGQSFEDAAWLTRLDVVFANRFLSAYADSAEGKHCAAPWKPLFDFRHRKLSPIKFALAGMNAHINHDLPLAIVATCKERDCAPVSDCAPHRDYHRVNVILGKVEARIKTAFEDGVSLEVDKAAGHVDDALEMWSIAEARALAWHHAETLWHLRDHPHLTKAYESMLALSVDFAGRGILV